MALGTAAHTLVASHPDLRRAVADVDRAADLLSADRDRVGRRVETLLDGGWRGPAATAYASGWAQWCAGADQVLDGLRTMGRLLEAVEVGYVESDRSAGAAAARIAARLG